MLHKILYKTKKKQKLKTKSRPKAGAWEGWDRGSAYPLKLVAEVKIAYGAY